MKKKSTKKAKEEEERYTVTIHPLNYPPTLAPLGGGLKEIQLQELEVVNYKRQAARIQYIHRRGSSSLFSRKKKGKRKMPILPPPGVGPLVVSHLEIHHSDAKFKASALQVRTKSHTFDSHNFGMLVGWLFKVRNGAGNATAATER